MQSLKIWPDRYVFPAECKGGGYDYSPDVVIVTSNFSLDDLLGPKLSPDIRYQYVSAIARRFHEMKMTDRSEQDDMIK